MCKAKPGLRCSGHATERFTQATKNLDEAKERAFEWKEKEYESRLEKDENAPYPKDKEMPKRLRVRVKNAFARHRSAQRGYYATPAGIDYLEAKEPEAYKKQVEAETKVSKYLLETYGELEEEKLKPRLAQDPQWNALRNERTKARSEFTRMHNRRKTALRYRVSDAVAGKMEKTRQKHLAHIKSADNVEEARARANKYWATRGNEETVNWYKTSAELQRNRDFSQQTRDAVGFDHIGKQEYSSHGIDVPQGGKMRVDVISGIKQDGDAYIVEHRTRAQMFPTNTNAPSDSRKGFGKKSEGQFFDDGHTESMRFSSVTQAQKWLRENRADIAYNNASLALSNATKTIERDTLADIIKEKSQPRPQPATV